MPFLAMDPEVISGNADSARDSLQGQLNSIDQRCSMCACDSLGFQVVLAS